MDRLRRLLLLATPKIDVRAQGGQSAGLNVGTAVHRTVASCLQAC